MNLLNIRSFALAVFLTGVGTLSAHASNCVGEYEIEWNGISGVMTVSDVGAATAGISTSEIERQPLRVSMDWADESSRNLPTFKKATCIHYHGPYQGGRYLPEYSTLRVTATSAGKAQIVSARVKEKSGARSVAGNYKDVQGVARSFIWKEYDDGRMAGSDEPVFNPPPPPVRPEPRRPAAHPQSKGYGVLCSQKFPFFADGKNILIELIPSNLYPEAVGTFNVENSPQSITGTCETTSDVTAAVDITSSDQRYRFTGQILLRGQSVTFTGKYGVSDGKNYRWIDVGSASAPAAPAPVGDGGRPCRAEIYQGGPPFVIYKDNVEVARYGNTSQGFNDLKSRVSRGECRKAAFDCSESYGSNNEVYMDTYLVTSTYVYDPADDLAALILELLRDTGVCR